MSYLKRMACSASGKRSNLYGSRKVEPELPEVPETRAKVFACDQPKPKKPTSRKSLGTSMKKWLKTWFDDYQSNEKILRREEHQKALEVNRIVISFGL